MNTHPKDDLDRVMDETLASMVEGQPSRVSAASVRQAMGESRGSRLPMWLAAAAALIVGLGVVLKSAAPIEKAPVAAQSTPSPSAAEIPNLGSASPVQLTTATKAAASRSTQTVLAVTNDEGLPRLAIATLEVPEPLSTNHLPADAILIPGIEITPISVSTLSTEQEHNQEPSR